jgi:hypothetical protein
MASYLKKEISEWNTTDLCNWLLANKFRGISELCQKYSLSGYDLFYINDDILKNELGLKSFHERNVALKLFTKLAYEHLRLNVINSNGDNVILTLDNNHETQLGEIADYIGNMFNINPKDILFKDSTKQEVLSPTVKIVRMLILYPKIYKTLNVSNMKDYHQAEEDMMESGDYQEENNNNNTKMKMDKNYKKEQQDFYSGSMDSDMLASGGMDLQNVANTKKMYNNSYNYNMQNNNKNNYRKMKVRENEQRNNLRQQNNEYMNYKYNNQDKINKNNKVNMNRERDNNNYEDQINNENNMNRMNMNGNDNNLDYNDEYQENIGKQYKNEDRPYIDQNERKRQNYQYQGGNNKIINYNEESNFGLMSSGNDDEMKFKPSYQIKNSDFDENKQNFENNDNENDNDNDNDN